MAARTWAGQTRSGVVAVRGRAASLVARARRSASRFRCGSASDEQRNLVFVVIHLATCEQVLLPGAEGEFPHGVAENPRQVRRDEFQRINAKPIHTRSEERRVGK